MNSWKVLYASLFGTLLGIVCKQFWHVKLIYTIVFFLSILALNKCSLWDQFSKIFGGLSFVIAAFIVTEGVSAGEVFVSNMLMINVPSFVVGVSLMFPPALAADSCSRKVRVIQKHLGNIATMYGYAVCHADFANMYLFEAEASTAAVNHLLKNLDGLISAVEAETMLFPQLEGMPESLSAFLKASRQIMIEFENIRSSHSRIVINTTHAHIMSVLESSLQQTLAAAAVALDLAADSVASYPDNLWHKKIMSSAFWVDFESLCCSRLAKLLETCAIFSQSKRFNRKKNDLLGRDDTLGPVDDLQIRPSNYISILIDLSTRKNLSGLVVGNSTNADDDLEMATNQSVASDNISGISGPHARLDGCRQDILEDLNAACVHIAELRKGLIQAIKHAREKYLFRTDKTPFVDTGDGSSSYKNINTSRASQELNPPDVDETLRSEYLALGVRNLVPRGAFMMHVIFICNEIVNLEAQLATISYSVSLEKGSSKRERPGFRSTAVKATQMAWTYAMSCLKAMLVIMRELLYSYILPVSVSGAKDISSFESYIYDLFVGYTQPFKIALAGTLCALLVIVPAWRSANPYGAWAAIVVMIVRQDSSSSSYLRGYQRLEGTVIGAVFSFAMIRIFSGIQDQRVIYDAILQVCLILWVGICAYFRELLTHGYSAAVAALTPIILIFGFYNNPNLESIAWSRVAMTFYAVAVYLMIDNAIFPTRSDALVRTGTSSVIGDIRATVMGCKDALKEVFSVTSFPNTVRNRATSAESSQTFSGIDRPENSTCAVGSPTGSSEGELGANVRLARASTMDSGACASTGTEPDVNTIVEGHVTDATSYYYSMLQSYTRCRHIIQDQVFPRIASLRSKLTIRSGQIDMAIYEPKLWHKAFPQSAYGRLQNATERAEHSLEAVSSSILYLCTTLAAMPVVGDGADTVSIALENLYLVGDMTKLLIDVSNIADVALENVAANINR